MSALTRLLGFAPAGETRRPAGGRLEAGIERLLRALSRAPVRIALGLLIVPRLVGAGVYSIAEADANWFDGVWWAGVTQTTVGYGDFSPETFAGRLTAEVIWWCGIVGVALLTGALAGVIAERRIEERKLMRVERTAELSDDFDHLVARAEADSGYLIEHLRRLKMLTGDARVQAALREVHEERTP